MEHSRTEFMMTDVFKEWVKSLEERDERERIRREEREEREERERMRRDERERERNQIRKEEQEEKRKEEMKSYLGRQIKDFNGSPEVYVSWKHNVQAVLTDSTLSPKDKLKCLSLKLVGEAMHIVPEANNLNSPEELFEFIDKALKKSCARIYAECKQKVSESVLSFSLRLTGLMKALSPDTALETTPLYKQQLTHLFRTGLHVNIQRELKTAYILDYEELLRQALVYEDEVVLHKMDKTRTGQLYHVSTEGEGKHSPNETLELHHLQNKGPQTNRIFPGICFACKKPGHVFYRCLTASKDEIAKVRENLPELVQQARARRTDQPKDNGVTSPPQ
jgi:hypothetical protein